jgi:hypothetical protein
VASIRPWPYRIHDTGLVPSTGSCARTAPAPSALTRISRLPAVPSAIVRTGSGCVRTPDSARVASVASTVVTAGAPVVGWVEVNMAV